MRRTGRLQKANCNASAKPPENHHDGLPALNLITTPIWLHVDQPDERLVTSYPISETPLSLILTDPVSLRPAGYETIVTERAGITQIAIHKDSGEGAGRLTLEFTTSPFQLRRWIVEDVAGIQTSVTLQNMALACLSKMLNLACQIISISNKRSVQIKKLINYDSSFFV